MKNRARTLMVVATLAGGLFTSSQPAGAVARIATTAAASPGATTAAATVAGAGGAPATGYWLLADDGKIFGFGAEHHGDVAGFGGHAIDIKASPDSDGYWMLDDIGEIGAFGSAHDYGNAVRAKFAAGERPVSMSPTPSGHGYWIFTNLGHVQTFGDATFHGDVGGLRLNGPVLGSVPTPTGNGYYMVASDGGVFTFGDASFHGSMGAARLNQPVMGLVPTPDNAGYWLVAKDGGVFAFTAPFRGSVPQSLRAGQALNSPIAGMVAYGNGYLMVAADGGVFDFSDTAFKGSLGANPYGHPIVAITAAPSAPTGADVLANSFRAVYAVPSDMTADASIVPAVQHEIPLINDWFASQNNGRRPRFVMDGSQIGVPQVTLDVPRATIEGAAQPSQVLIDALGRAGYPKAGEKLVVYIPTLGDSGDCALESMNLAVLWMPRCNIVPKADTPSFPYGATYVIGHEMTHLFGAVPPCAPHYDGTGHVKDDPRDVVYFGPIPRDYAHLMLDPGHDDYFDTGRSDCTDIALSPLWQ